MAAWQQLRREGTLKVSTASHSRTHMAGQEMGGGLGKGGGGGGAVAGSIVWLKFRPSSGFGFGQGFGCRSCSPPEQGSPLPPPLQQVPFSPGPSPPPLSAGTLQSRPRPGRAGDLDVMSCPAGHGGYTDRNKRGAPPGLGPGTGSICDTDSGGEDVEVEADHAGSRAAKKSRLGPQASGMYWPSHTGRHSTAGGVQLCA